MPNLTPEDVLTALKSVVDPVKNTDVVSLGMVQGLLVKDGHVSFALEVAPEDGRTKEPLRLAAERAVLALSGARSVTAVLTAHKAATPPPRRAALNSHMQAEAAPRAGAAERQGPPGVKAVIAVASGKGGVGKSTVAVNLAIALTKLGRTVGLLDADIYGPSIPRMLGLTGKPTSKDGKKLQPMNAWGLKAISIGSLIDEDQPMIWRGPMVMTALTQLIYDVEWAPLDVLVVDMPPGTGDAQLTLAQRVPLAGAIIVSTPQDIALIDARKGLAMFKKTHVPVFGIVENMSTFVCPNCGHESHIFGHGGARETATKLGADFLGEIPLHIAIRETSDGGTPITASDPNSPQAQAFLQLAERVAAKLDAGDNRPAPRITME
ncbi:MAG: iron-sulfur cluster carrier protein ApbC [Alphaproteobacteria bacterium]|nr:iron-sulfur cluster carrier protein ApbC [Alphaproteobacteria bacterium]